MKCILWGALSVLGWAEPASAQFGRIGIKAGACLTTLVGPGTPVPPKISPLLGGVAGVYRSIGLGAGGRWALQPELLYSQQGHRLSNVSTGYAATLRSHYVCLPVLLTFAHRGFFGEVGPQVGYLVGVREEYRIPSPAVVGITKRVNTSPAGLPRWDGAGVAGLGYRWTGGVGLEVRYAGSFTGVYANRSGRTKARPRHAALQVLASFPLHR